jgi:hypothetical protein
MQSPDNRVLLEAFEPAGNLTTSEAQLHLCNCLHVCQAFINVVSVYIRIFTDETGIGQRSQISELTGWSLRLLYYNGVQYIIIIIYWYPNDPLLVRTVAVMVKLDVRAKQLADSCMYTVQ